jgi:hypothetical protein
MSQNVGLTREGGCSPDAKVTRACRLSCRLCMCTYVCSVSPPGATLQFRDYSAHCCHDNRPRRRPLHHRCLASLPFPSPSPSPSPSSSAVVPVPAVRRGRRVGAVWLHTGRAFGGTIRSIMRRQSLLMPATPVHIGMCHSISAPDGTRTLEDFGRWKKRRRGGSDNNSDNRRVHCHSCTRRVHNREPDSSEKGN